jgi:hypothetical protein
MTMTMVPTVVLAREAERAQVHRTFSLLNASNVEFVEPVFAPDVSRVGCFPGFNISYIRCGWLSAMHGKRIAQACSHIEQL